MHTEDSIRHKAVWGWTGGVVILALSLVAGAGCGSTPSDSPAFLMIDSLEGAPGYSPGTSANTLQSDVLTKGSPFEDPGFVVFRLGLRDPGAMSGALIPGPLNYITVTHYRVVYTRSDGHNTPGVDVPYPIEGGMTMTAIGGVSAGTFVLVRAQAKLEAPLRALIGLGAQAVISTIAQVTFYGADQAGNAISTTGYITVTFADWGDPT
jgi:hypothetical protein